MSTLKHAESAHNIHSVHAKILNFTLNKERLEAGP